MLDILSVLPPRLAKPLKTCSEPRLVKQTQGLGIRAVDENPPRMADANSMLAGNRNVAKLEPRFADATSGA
jgi:hypothetical protein